jgi:hypothetical protein
VSALFDTASNKAAEKLMLRGWTVESLNDRIAGCVAGLREIDRSKPSGFTYRLLLINLWRAYRADRRTLSAYHARAKGGAL